MASVRFQQVTKSYPGAAAPAIGCVDLEIREGELFVLLGPSGCGKSTLLKLVAGIEEPDDGAVWVGGRVVNYVPPAQRDVAMVFQNYALYPHMTVEQNVRFPLRMRRAPRREADEAVARALALLDLQEYAGRSVSQLSGGQRQRVAVARALVRRPAVLLMDEPLSNLDALLRAQLREQLIELHGRVGGTIVYVTHDQVEAMTMGHRIAVMNHGAMVQVGTPAEIYGAPADRFVAGFIGAPPMNFVDGELREVNGEPCFAGAGLTVGLPERLAAGAGRSGPITLGVRPEVLGLDPDAADDGGWRVEVVENLGREHIVTARRGDAVLRASLPGTAAIARGDAVAPRVAPDDVYLFDVDGRNVTRDQAARPPHALEQR